MDPSGFLILNFWRKINLWSKNKNLVFGNRKLEIENMSFFKFDKETKTEDLKLSDYNQIWTKFCFLDETGSLNNPNDPFFTVGILKLSQPYAALSYE